MDLRNQKVVVVGLGTSGLDAALLLDDLGAIVSATENDDNETVRKNLKTLEHRYIETEIGGHTEKFLKGSNLIVVSPGVPRTSMPIKYGLEDNIPIISELELGYIVGRGRIIAVTGTNGKSTVVSLVGEILKKAGKKVCVCGNIGNSLSGEIRHIDSKTICVVEVSSFQLEWIMDFRPRVSCILNITEDHLDRYCDFKDYINTKLRILSNQKEGDISILNYDDDNLRIAGNALKYKHLFYSRNNKVEGVHIEAGDVIYKSLNKSKKLLSLPSVDLRGSHNIENIMAALLISLTQGVKPEIFVEALKEYKPLSHRMQKIAEINGIEFIDDSKATNINATKRALESLDKKIVLIAGGRGKGANYAIIRDQIRSKVKKLILIGEEASSIKNTFMRDVEIEISKTLEEATNLAYKSAGNNDIVLLSPMCSSFDMFSDYKHRSEVFRSAVDSLKSKVRI